MRCSGEATIKLSHQMQKNWIILRNEVGRREEEERHSFLQLVIKHKKSCIILICSYDCSHLRNQINF